MPDGTPMGGYADRRGGSSGAADPLEAHVLTCTDGRRRFALVVLDVVCVNVDLADEVRHALGALGVDDAWVCATHTHSGPETGCVPGGAATPAPWATVIGDAAVRAARAAIAAEAPGSLTSATMPVAGVASVRSRPDGARPVPVEVVSCHGAAGLRGVLVVLPVHPTVLPAHSTVLSADLTGAVRRELGSRVGGWVVVATGAAGDISTRGVRRGADPAECARLGRVVADQLRSTVDDGGSPGTVSTAAATVAVTPGEAPVRGEPGSSSRQEETLRQAWELRRPITEPMPCTVRAARIDGITLIGLPGEPFLGLRVPGVLLLGYVGGYVGYLPTREAFAGAATYETVISPVAAGEPERLVAVGLDLLSRLAH